MEATLHLDFETRSTIDLRRVGLHKYADPASTRVLCVAYAFNDEPVEIFIPGQGSIPQRILDHVKAGREVWAHNASFEFEIWNKVFAPSVPMKLEQTVCTMAMAYAMGLPGSLDNCAAALGLNHRKDLEGSRIMLQLSKPKDELPDGTLTWWDTPEKFERLYAYCKQDVIVEREVAKRMFRLSPYEQKVWILDQEINQRGIYVDKKAVEKAVELVEEEKDRLNATIRNVSNNNIATCTAVQQIKDYLKPFGVTSESLDKSAVNGIIDDPKTHPHAREILALRQLGGRAATAKLEPMLNGIGADQRLRGCFQYSGANTRRWAGRRVQLHNLKRPSMKHEVIEDIVGDISKGVSAEALALFYGEPLDILSECIRSFLCGAPGKDLITCDFSAIESRVLAWLAGQDDKLKQYIDGKNIYLLNASSIFGVSITDKNDPRYHIGKIAELALGYQGGVGAFMQMAKGYGVKLEPVFDTLWNSVSGKVQEYALTRFNQSGEKYEISKNEFLATEITKIKWREANPHTVNYWQKAEQAFINAVLEPGTTTSIGTAHRAVRFTKSGSFLFCRLPSGGVISYPYPELKEAKTPWGATKLLPTYMSEDGQSKKWQRFSTYGGSIVENICQATARDLLAHSMLEVTNKNYKIVAHVHDEIICEMPIHMGSLEEVQTIMSIPPQWAFDLPLASAGWRGMRYRK